MKLPVGVYQYNSWNTSVANIDFNPDLIDGLVVRIYWKYFYDSDGNLDFSMFEEYLESATQNDLDIKIIIAPGVYSPQWVINDSETIDLIVSNGEEKGNELPHPLPWDLNYLNHWFDFLEEFASRFANHPKITYMAVTGPNGHNGEVALPREQSDKVKWNDLVNNNADALRLYLEAAYTLTLQKFKELFRNKFYYTIAIINDSLPIGNSTIENLYKTNLINIGTNIDNVSFGLQTNGLNGTKNLAHWYYISAFNGFTAFQSRVVKKLFPDLDLYPRDMVVDGLGGFQATPVTVSKQQYKINVLNEMSRIIFSHNVKSVELPGAIINNPLYEQIISGISTELHLRYP